ncbi:hypothetical protein CQ13_37700 [Bradyrhizobium retamae]|uniref:Uncharacterized protein n=2 Tax=Bradyrhizobium retamae TaxID=1300035 RepID=A0A0R3MCA2_9BRAD|nr:hypothetical protein CQ13_37700 [Bradyrhizobium retamae]
MVASIGFKLVAFADDRHERCAGSEYPLAKLVRLAADAPLEYPMFFVRFSSIVILGFLVAFVGVAAYSFYV